MSWNLKDKRQGEVRKRAKWIKMVSISFGGNILLFSLFNSIIFCLFSRIQPRRPMMGFPRHLIFTMCSIRRLCVCVTSPSPPALGGLTSVWYGKHSSIYHTTPATPNVKWSCKHYVTHYSSVWHRSCLHSLSVAHIIRFAMMWSRTSQSTPKL